MRTTRAASKPAITSRAASTSKAIRHRRSICGRPPAIKGRRSYPPPCRLTRALPCSTQTVRVRVPSKPSNSTWIRFPVVRRLNSKPRASTPATSCMPATPCWSKLPCDRGSNPQETSASPSTCPRESSQEQFAFWSLTPGTLDHALNQPRISNRTVDFETALAQAQSRHPADRIFVSLLLPDAQAGRQWTDSVYFAALRSERTRTSAHCQGRHTQWRVRRRRGSSACRRHAQRISNPQSAYRARRRFRLELT